MAFCEDLEQEIADRREPQVSGSGGR
jgi:hypothetical protein